MSLLEQKYFCYDKPVPFKENLVIYPVLVKDYYKFHSCIPIFMLKKNEDPSGKGIALSNLGYALYKMKEEKEGPLYTAQMIGLLELIFHIKNGLYCDNKETNCNFFKSYEDVWGEVQKGEGEEEQITLMMKAKICPKCGREMREVISIKGQGSQESLAIKEVEINKKDYDYLFQTVLYQNIPTWEDPEFVDPDLKKELEERQKMLNKDMVPPTLEKQKAVIIANGCNYKYDELDNITIRRLSVLIANIDRMMHYQIYKTSELSGLVQYKTEIEHYLYSNKKKSITDDVFSMDSLKEKLKDVAK